MTTEFDQHDMTTLETEAEVLIGRMIDGEATGTDRESFHRLAATDASLWELLARRAEQIRLLGHAVDEELAVVDHVDVPTYVEPAPGRWWPMVALSGWAAVLALAGVIVWMQLTGGTAVERGELQTVRPEERDSGPQVRGPDVQLHDVDPQRLLRAYLAAPHVTGELQPVLLEVETLEDGRIRKRILRRIEELEYLDPATSDEVISPGGGTT